MMLVTGKKYWYARENQYCTYLGVKKGRHIISLSGKRNRIVDPSLVGVAKPDSFEELYNIMAGAA